MATVTLEEPRKNDAHSKEKGTPAKKIHPHQSYSDSEFSHSSLGAPSGGKKSNRLMSSEELMFFCVYFDRLMLFRTLGKTQCVTKTTENALRVKAFECKLKAADRVSKGKLHQENFAKTE